MNFTSKTFPRRLIFAWFLFSLLLLTACQSMYYDTMETFGIEKRNILVSRVESAQESQQDAKQQFESALEQFIAVTNYSGGDLEKQYKKLKNEYEDSQSKAEKVRDRIDAVESVARDLFEEWQQELAQYSSQTLRRSSEQQLKNTQRSYNKLIRSMNTAEKKIKPVLTAFYDRVLFLKHNLNANAIASLRSEKKTVETDITSLIREMNNAIAEADRFIQSMTIEQRK